MAATISFVKNQTTVTLPAPSGQAPAREVKRQALGRSAGGTVYAYDKGVDTYEVELRLEALDDAEKEALAAFFHTTVDGVRETFTYTDSGGNASTARFLEPTLAFDKSPAGTWAVRLKLELSAMGQ